MKKIVILLVMAVFFLNGICLGASSSEVPTWVQELMTNRKDQESNQPKISTDSAGRRNIPVRKVISGDVVNQLPARAQEIVASADVAGEPPSGSMKDVPTVQGEKACALNRDPALDAKLLADAAMQKPRGGKKTGAYEVSAYVGGSHKFESGSDSAFFVADLIGWKEDQERRQKFGIGATVRADHWWSKDRKYDGGKFAVGPNFDYGANLSETDRLLLKFRPLWAWEKGGNSGFMPGGYFEYAHQMSKQNTFIMAMDGSHFVGGGSYASLKLLVEHEIDKNSKVEGGVKLATNFKTNGLSFGPVIAYEHGDWEFSLGLDLLHGGAIMPMVGYNVMNDIREADSDARAASLKLVEK